MNGASGGLGGDTGEAGGMEDLDVFEPDWIPEGLGSTLNASSTSGPGGGVTIHNGGGTGSGSGSGLSMRKSFKSTLTRLSDGSGRRMRKTSRSSLLGDKEMGLGSESSGRPGSSRAASPSTNTNQAQIQQQQQQNQQYRGLGIGRPEVDAGGTVRKAVGPKDTHYFDTVAEYSGLSIPIRVPLSIFPEEVGDVSRGTKSRCGTLPVLTFFPGPTVLDHTAHPDVYAFSTGTLRPTVSPSTAYRGRIHTSYHPLAQRATDPEEDHLPGSWTTSGTCGQLRPGGVCADGTRPAWVCREGFPLFESGWAGHSRRGSGVHRRCNKSAFRRSAAYVGSLVQPRDGQDHSLEGSHER